MTERTKVLVWTAGIVLYLAGAGATYAYLYEPANPSECDGLSEEQVYVRSSTSPHSDFGAYYYKASEKEVCLAYQPTGAGAFFGAVFWPVVMPINAGLHSVDK